jgi:hypothetical protein
MMRLLLSLFMAAGIAATANAETCRPGPADQSGIIEVMRSVYRAAAADDLAAFQSLILPGFYAYDGGLRFEGDGLMRWVMAAHGKGDVFTWSVDEPDVHIGCEEAWIAYVNRGSVKHAESPAVAVSWLESANLRKVDGVWKLVFFHSARAPAPIPPQ